MHSFIIIFAPVSLESAYIYQGPLQAILETTLLHWCNQVTSYYELTPMGALIAVQEADSDGKKQTAIHMLSFSQELNKLFLQDACVSTGCLLDQACTAHPMFIKLPVFASLEIAQFKLDMKRALENDRLSRLSLKR